MPYNIGFVAKGQTRSCTDERATATAGEALQLVQAFRANGDAIRFITTPSGTKIVERDLENRAEQERNHLNQALAPITSEYPQ
jgi:hypothetical protein